MTNFVSPAGWDGREALPRAAPTDRPRPKEPFGPAAGPAGGRSRVPARRSVSGGPGAVAMTNFVSPAGSNDGRESRPRAAPTDRPRPESRAGLRLAPRAVGPACRLGAASRAVPEPSQ